MVYQDPDYFFTLQHLYAIVHLFAFAFWYGSILYVSFIGGIIMFKNMTKPDFSAIQSKLFPVYFRLGNVCGKLPFIFLVRVISPLNDLAFHIELITM